MWVVQVFAVALQQNKIEDRINHGKNQSTQKNRPGGGN
jgi:hypothetical protein